MLLKYFNSNRISVFIVIPVLVILCWLPDLLKPENAAPVNEAFAGVLGKYVIRLNANFIVISRFIAMVIVMANGFMLLQLNTLHFFIPYRTQFPALLYMLLCSAFPMLISLTPALIASSLFILLLFRVFATYKHDYFSYNFLDAGLIISIASLFYIPAFFLYPLLLIIMAIIRPYIWREWIFSAIGLLVPFLLILAINYLLDTDIKIFTDSSRHGFLSIARIKDFSIVLQSFTGYVGLLILISSIRMANSIGNIKIQSRKFFISFFWMFILSLLTFFIVSAAGIDMIYFICIPVSFLMAYYFTFCRKNWVNNLLLFLFFAGIAAVKILA